MFPQITATELTLSSPRLPAHVRVRLLHLLPFQHKPDALLLGHGSARASHRFCPVCPRTDAGASVYPLGDYSVADTTLRCRVSCGRDSAVFLRGWACCARQLQADAALPVLMGTRIRCMSVLRFEIELV